MKDLIYRMKFYFKANLELRFSWFSFLFGFFLHSQYVQRVVSKYIHKWLKLLFRKNVD